MTIKKKKKSQKISVVIMWRKLELLCTVGGNVKWYSSYGKQYRGFFKK